MAFEELNEHTDQLKEEAKNYVQTSLAYYRLKAFKLTMKSLALIFKIILVASCFSILFIFCSFALAYWLGDAFHSRALGFLIVGGIYLFFTIVIYLLRKRIIEGFILRKFSKIFFND